MTHYSEDLNLKPIVRRKFKRDSIENVNIGVIDLETFKNEKLNKDFVYAAGFHSNRNINNEPNIFYINNDLNSDEVILRLIDGILNERYTGITFLLSI